MAAWTAGVPVEGPNTDVISTMPRRFGAWLLDYLFVGLLNVIPLVAVFVLGGIRFTQAAMDGVETNSDHPFQGMTSPILQTNTATLVILAAALVAGSAVYHIWSWAGPEASPGQRIAGIRVVDVDSGKRLSLEQVVVRWILLYGLVAVASAFVIVALLQEMATLPGSQFETSYSGTGEDPLSVTTGFVSLFLIVWYIVLLVSSVAANYKRGVHDKGAGSVVVHRVAALTVQPYGSPYGYGPEIGRFGGYAAGQAGFPPPTPPPYGAPPSYPNYPGAGYPGYPGQPSQPGFGAPAGFPGQPGTGSQPPLTPGADQPPDRSPDRPASGEGSQGGSGQEG